MDNSTQKAFRIAKEMMYDNDPFSQWLGIEIIEIGPGNCKLRMKVRKEMCNGFNMAHGGITYSLADSALAFASNSYGPKAVSIETSVSHVTPVYTDDILNAETQELSHRKKISIFQITVTNQNNETVALFKGTVYKTSKNWID